MTATGRAALALLLAFALRAAWSTPPAAAAPPASSAVDEGALADSVRQELLHCWHAYVRYAWGHDEVRPLSREFRDWYKQPVLMTPVDALDALLLMGFKAQADSARALIVERLSFDRDDRVQVFRSEQAAGPHDARRRAGRAAPDGLQGPGGQRPGTDRGAALVRP